MTSLSAWFFCAIVCRGVWWAKNKRCSPDRRAGLCWKTQTTDRPTDGHNTTADPEEERSHTHTALWWTTRLFCIPVLQTLLDHFFSITRDRENFDCGSDIRFFVVVPRLLRSPLFRWSIFFSLGGVHYASHFSQTRFPCEHTTTLPRKKGKFLSHPSASHAAIVISHFRPSSSSLSIHHSRTRHLHDRSIDWLIRFSSVPLPPLYPFIIPAHEISTIDWLIDWFDSLPFIILADDISMIDWLIDWLIRFSSIHHSRTRDLRDWLIDWLIRFSSSRFGAPGSVFVVEDFSSVISGDFDRLGVCTHWIYSKSSSGRGFGRAKMLVFVSGHHWRTLP